MKFKYILIPLLIFGFLAIAVLIFGSVSGEEFSAQKFTRRRFSYFQIPLVRQQLTPVTFKKSWNGGDELASHLRSIGLLGDVASKPIRWDIVHIHEIGGQGSKGDAEILTKYFEHWGAVGGSTWLTWTQNRANAEVAATLWPLVAKLADENLYFLIPDLFDAARATTDASEFLEGVRPGLVESINKLAEIEARKESQQAAGQDAPVAGQESVKIEPDQKASVRLKEFAVEIQVMVPSKVNARMIKDFDDREATMKKNGSKPVAVGSQTAAASGGGDNSVDAEADPEDIP